jgi:hypothetical protein
MVVHKNITPLLGVVSDFDRPQTPGLVCPFYRHGDIMKYLKNQPNADKLALVSCRLNYDYGRSLLNVASDFAGGIGHSVLT